MNKAHGDQLKGLRVQMDGKSVLSLQLYDKRELEDKIKKDLNNFEALCYGVPRGGKKSNRYIKI